jgi:hypothetical protein
MLCNKADAVRVGPPEGVKNCDYNINRKMKNFPIELSIKIMLIVDIKVIEETSQFFYE